MHYIIIRWKGGKMKVDAVSQCPSRLRDFALTSCSADINAKSIRWNSSSILHGVGRSIIKGKSADYHYRNSSFWLKSACLYHFFDATQKDFALFLYLCTR